MGWKEIVSTVAPTIGAALGGPLGGMATSAVLSAMGLPAASTDKDIDSLFTSSPELMLEVKKAEIEFKQRLAELDIDLERVHADDRNSARQRQAAVKDKMPALLGILVTFGFFGVLGWLLGFGIPDNGGEALLVMLGSLGAAWAGVMQYYFGSTSGSNRKNELLARR